MSNVVIQSRINPQLKKQADALFASIGISTSDAVRMFLQQSVNIGGLPFQPKAKLPNTETSQAIKDIEQGNVIHAKTNQQMYDDLDI